MAQTSQGIPNNGQTAHYQISYDTSLSTVDGLTRPQGLFHQCEFDLMASWFTHVIYRFSLVETRRKLLPWVTDRGLNDMRCTGTSWQVVQVDGNNPNIVALKCLGDIEGARWLDGRTTNGTVGLASTTEPPFTGTKWEARMYPVTIDENQ